MFRASLHKNLRFKSDMAAAAWSGDVIAEDSAWKKEEASLPKDLQISRMRGVQRLKFSQNSRLRDRLLQLSGLQLIFEDEDDFWGVGKNGTGQNWLGKLLMEVCVELNATSQLESFSFEDGQAQQARDTIVWRVQSDFSGLTVGVPMESRLSPSLEEADPMGAFLYSLVPGSAPNTLDAIIQVPEGAKEGLQVSLATFGTVGFSGSAKHRYSPNPLPIDQMQLLGYFHNGSCGSFGLYQFSILLLRHTTWFLFTAKCTEVTTRFTITVKQS